MVMYDRLKLRLATGAGGFVRGGHDSAHRCQMTSQAQ